jgi:hypothetical protein
MAVSRGSLVLDYAHARLTDALIGQYEPAAVCRYVLGAARDQGKGLRAAEAQWLGERGIPILCNFEYATSPILTASQGAADARDAQSALLAAGMPPGSPVVFSMDRDLAIGEIPAVLRYWSGAQSVLGWGKGLDGQIHPRAGLYGEFDLIERAGPAGVHWLWQASAWSRGLLSKHALLYQIPDHEPIPGYDRNIAQVPDFGQRFPIGYGDDMNLSDMTTVPAGLVRYFPAKIGVTSTTKMTVEELLWQCMMRGAQAEQAVRDTETADASRDTALATLVKAVSTGAIDVKALGDQLLAVLAPAQALALADVLRRTHLAVDGT